MNFIGFKLKKYLFLILIAINSTGAFATGANQTINQIYYCGEDFALQMSGGDWYLVQRKAVGDKKFDHFLSMSMFMMASNKKTANIFPGEPLDNWCGNKGFKPINKLSMKN